jgi:hypothetical protein
MTVRFVIKHALRASEQQFWAEIFRSEGFNRALYIDHLGFGYELELWEPQTGRRRARIWPITHVPKAFMTVLGGEISLLEEGVCDASADRYDFRIIPSRFPERIRVGGSVVTTPLSDDTCERTVSFEIEVRVFAFINEYLGDNC